MRQDDGSFIVFEGIDGAGTTTQSARFARYLRQHRRVVHTTREPSDGPVGHLLRLALGGRVDLGPAHTMALLFAADRLDHVNQEIRPHLRDGSVVICDRYDLSSIAYQTATAPAEERESFESWVRELNRYAVRPDVTVILHVDPAEAEKRRANRQGAPELFEESQLQKDLATLYRDAERLRPGDTFVHIDGNQTADEVEQAIRGAVEPIL